MAMKNIMSVPFQNPVYVYYHGSEKKQIMRGLLLKKTDTFFLNTIPLSTKVLNQSTVKNQIKR